MFAVPTPQDIGLLEADKVAQIATALDVRLELFHCVFDADVAHPGQFTTAGGRDEIQRLVSAAEQGLERIAERLRSRGLSVKTGIRWDSPVHESIVRQILRHGPSLLIARASRLGEVGHLLPSHTDWKLIETCPCPLLLLKSPRPYSQPLVIAAVDPGHAHDKPAELDEQILESARLLSDALSGRLQVFHARIPWDEAIHLDPELYDLPEYRDEEIHGAYLAQVETRVLQLAGKHNIAREQVTIQDGHAAQSLPLYANQPQAQIVVTGAVSRSRMRRTLMGDTAERALGALHCDALIIKPPGFRTPVPRQSTHHVEAGTELGSRLRR
ncbi:MAG TPA: universal stress protein [Steroidobacteraceae bacterium]|nr:universal stress protein [Steroidobacteraceae bacterium]